MAYIVMCRVSGGVTGTREAPLKDRAGAVQTFDTRAAAAAEASRLTNLPRHFSTADFRYWPEEVTQ